MKWPKVVPKQSLRVFRCPNFGTLPNLGSSPKLPKGGLAQKPGSNIRTSRVASADPQPLESKQIPIAKIKEIPVP